jgi:flagellar hook assembly protein FlgD
VDYLKNWIADRLDWLDINMGEVREQKVYVSINDQKTSEYMAISAYPNPFQNELNISLELEGTHHVFAVVYNQMGQEVYVLNDSDLFQGEHVFKWDGSNVQGGLESSGVYMYTLFIDHVPQYKGKVVKQ